MTSTIAVEEVRALVSGVADPEMPAVTIGMLGMVHDVAVDRGTVTVELLPTFAGCPATEMIRNDVTTVLADHGAVDEVVVRFRFDPAWTPERITEQGRQRLASFGIAPPRAVAGSSVLPDGVAQLPVASITQPATGRTCPWCGSVDTTRDSSFGPTPCRDLWMCHACRQPFEGFKSA